MRKLLMLTAVLLALGSSPGLAGPTVHKELLGSWCFMGQDEITGKNRYYEQLPGSKECDDAVTTFKLDRLHGWEHGCRYTAVKTWFDPDIVATTKTWGVKVSRIEASCEGDGCTWRAQITAYVSKGTLNTTIRRYQARCP
jgi:hypothetical protein